LPLLLKVLGWRRRSSLKALNELSSRGFFVDARDLRRVSALANVICDRLRSLPVDGFSLGEAEGQEKVERLLRALDERRAYGERDPPAALVLGWQKQYGQLLAKVRLS
jgi:hypothetical protein